MTSSVWAPGTNPVPLAILLALPTGASLVGGSDQVVTSIASLRLLSKLSPSKYAYVIGYYAAGDGGGGQYYYDSTDTTSTDNGGTIIVAADGARWKLQSNSSSITCKQFGVLGEGVVNYTARTIAYANTIKNMKFPAGIYLLDTVALPAIDNMVIEGDGIDLTIFNAGTLNASQGILYVDSGSSGVQIENLHIKDLTLQDDVGTLNFSEFIHLMSLNGVKNVIIERVKFKGFRGDGLYVGSGSSGGQERHNKNVTIKNCQFDGVNNDNRNAISVIDCDYFECFDNTFANCTKSTMPGAIDFEPDVNTYHVIRNITVRDNSFINCGGNVAVISFSIPGTVVVNPSNILIDNNTIQNYTGSGSFFFFNANRAITETSSNNTIKLSNNEINSGSKPFHIYAKGVSIYNNTFTDMTGDALIGFTGATDKARNVDLNDNNFIRCGSISGACLSIFSVDYVHVFNNTFSDCGTGIVGASNAIDFNVGVSTNISFKNNSFISPTAKTLVAIQKEGSHTFTSSTNTFLNNQLNSLTTFFEAGISDATDIQNIIWVPTPIGATVAGAATAGVSQSGAYRKIAGVVTVSGNFAFTAHSGTGQLVLALPASVNALEAGFIPVDVVVTGTGIAVGVVVIGMINTGANRIQFYTLSTGSIAAYAVPANCEVYFSCVYAGT